MQRDPAAFGRRVAVRKAAKQQIEDTLIQSSTRDFRPETIIAVIFRPRREE